MKAKIGASMTTSGTTEMTSPGTPMLTDLEIVRKYIYESGVRFREYETSHRAKRTQDGDEKARRNHEMADKAEWALGSVDRLTSQAAPLPGGLEADADVELFGITVLCAQIEFEISKHPRTGDNVPKRKAMQDLVRAYVEKKIAEQALRSRPVVDREALVGWFRQHTQYVGKNWSHDNFADSLLSSGLLHAAPSEDEIADMIYNHLQEYFEFDCEMAQARDLARAIIALLNRSEG